MTDPRTDPRTTLLPLGEVREGPTPLASVARLPKRVQPKPDYVELHARSAFSFLRGSSLPEELAETAAAQGHSTFGLTDVAGVYGAPRFHYAARKVGLRAIVGAEVDVLGIGRLALLVEDVRGYQNLCRLLTLGHVPTEEALRIRAASPLGAPKQSRRKASVIEKARCVITPEQLTDFRQGWVAISTGKPAELCAAADLLGTERLFAEIQRHKDPAEARENLRRLDCARARGIPIVAGNGVRHARPAGKPLFDALTCIRLGLTLDGAGRRLVKNAERHIRTPLEMSKLFSDLPEALKNTRCIAERCVYTLGDLDYKFPTPPLEYATSIDGELWHRTLDGARGRYGGPHLPDG
ncbi:MAG: PHP domain-containing protein, partial [Deltaproteobacteria bacterium]|nr:PHP domain-containing protein [Deltaproteobacteria bacterium]